MKKLIGALLFLIAMHTMHGQDIHFSQYYMTPLHLNPALTGLFDGDYRAGAIYRSQWSAVPVPYSTVSLFGDTRLNKALNQSDKSAVGVLFNNDISGDSKYGTTQIYVPLSYIHKVNADSTLFMSVGLQPGISTIGFRLNQLSFDNQWDGDAYNPALSSGENFSTLRRTYFDLNAGFAVQYNLMQHATLLTGISFSHLTKPKVSYFNNEEIKLDGKLNYFASFTYPIGGSIDVKADLMFEKQGKYKELLFGGSGIYHISTKEKHDLIASLFLRSKDAFIIRMGYDIKQWQFGMSYDINTSDFQAATNRRGAVEFSLIYIFKKEIPFIPKKRSCPIYM